MENPGKYQAEPKNLDLSHPQKLVDDKHDIQQITYRQGPIEASELEAYNQLVPGFAERYLSELFVGAEHQRKIELLEIEQEKSILEAQKEIFNKNHRRSLLASKLGALIILVAILTAGGLAYFGKEKTAVAIVASLAGVSTIIYGTDAYNKIKEKQIEASNGDNIQEEN
ncbi:hypothetical protein IQ218_11715 [Synechocystis salina LEGE 06099]|uniref:hypothetical protein n=1 Tax=Synechocystis salina TaxID=945780 RepID=UPI001882E59F|nr:hypothetical protein [Synechocystis salina]MBE9203984.1 hypothetical protein [Synechocystis salina LEGE 06099]